MNTKPPKVFQNRKRNDSDTEKDDSDEDDEEMPEGTGRTKVFDISKRRYGPTRKKNEIQIETNSSSPGHQKWTCESTRRFSYNSGSTGNEKENLGHPEKPSRTLSID